MFVLTETYVNGTLLANAIDNGLIGGWSLAALISAFNILVGILSGFYLPRLWGSPHSARWGRVLSVVLAAVALASVLVVNLAVSYVRTFGMEAISTGITGFWQGGIVPLNLEALMLFGIGVGVALLTAPKFGTLRDPVPAFEAAHRAAQLTRMEIEHLDRDAPSVLQGVADAGHARLDGMQDAAADAVNRYRRLLEESQVEFRTFDSDCQRIRHVHEQCMEKRRGALKALCTAFPRHWMDGPPVIDATADEFCDLSDDVERLKVYEGRQDELEAAVASAHEHFEHLLRRARESIELVAVTTVSTAPINEGNIVQMRFKRDA
ncbi:MAG: hypothetical protein AAGK00_00640 [Pseudomonadota bacterium]